MPYLSELRERVARAICRAARIDPDHWMEAQERFAWTEWTAEADAAIAEVSEFLEDAFMRKTELPDSALCAADRKIPPREVYDAELRAAFSEIIKDLALNLEASKEPAISEDHPRHSGEAQ